MELGNRKRWLCLGLTAFILLLPLRVEAASELGQKKQQLKNVKGQIHETRTKLRTYKAQEKTVTHEISRLDQYMTEKEEQLTDLDQQLSATKRKVTIVRADLEETQANLNEQVTLLNARLRDTYKNGDISYLELLFGAEDFSDFLSRIHFMSLIIKQDLELIDTIEKEKKQVEVQKQELEKKEQSISRIQQEVSIKKEELEAHRAQRKAALDRIQQEKVAYETALNELEKTSQDLASMIQRIQARSSYKPKNKRPGSTVNTSSGAMRWPLQGSITSDFGYRVHPIFKTRKLHTGLDIATRQGTPIVAAKDGVVIYSGWMGGYGKAIIIDHGGGISTLYGHCSALIAGEGQEVDRGQLIARVGNTGFSTGPHCHFEVRSNGNPVNPRSYL